MIVNVMIMMLLYVLRNLIVYNLLLNVINYHCLVLHKHILSY